jgi:transketolase
MNKSKLEFLEEKSKNMRKDIIEMLGQAGSGHPGGSLSAVDIIVSLYYEIMDFKNNDKFILSKGHAAPALYSVLADKEYFDRKELKTLRTLGSILQGHPDMNKTPGVDFSTGSLGQGLSAANGMALASKYKRHSNHIYALLGDGELQEGQIWEAVMTANHRKLDNLIVFIDYNRLQIDGSCADIKSLDKIAEKFAAFDWETYEINGHDFNEILEAVKKAKISKNKPHAIICNTTKGKGVSFMEDQVGWHGKAPGEKEVKTALEELRGEL